MKPHNILGFPAWTESNRADGQLGFTLSAWPCFSELKHQICSWMFQHNERLKPISNLTINNKVCFCFIHVDMRPLDTNSSDGFDSSKKGWIATSSQLPPAGLEEQQHAKTPSAPPPLSDSFRLADQILCCSSSGGKMRPHGSRGRGGR